MSSHSLIQAVEVMDDLKIAFHRATRVQDRARSTHQRVATEVERSAEPCGLGVSRTWEQKNEYLLSLNTMEAMAIHVASSGRFKLKIAVGGVNIATSAPEISLSGREQDYFVAPDQMWIDGFPVEENLARQFVVLAPGTGFSVEHQLTGKDMDRLVDFKIFSPKQENFRRSPIPHLPLSEPMTPSSPGFAEPVQFEDNRSHSEPPKIPAGSFNHVTMDPFHYQVDEDAWEEHRPATLAAHSPPVVQTVERESSRGGSPAPPFELEPNSNLLVISEPPKFEEAADLPGFGGPTRSKGQMWQKKFDTPEVRFAGSNAGSGGHTGHSATNGVFTGDLDFAAHVSAGMESAGFDPNMLVDEPAYGQSESPEARQQRISIQTSNEMATEHHLTHESSSKKSAKKKRKKGKSVLRFDDADSQTAEPLAPEPELETHVPVEGNGEFTELLELGATLSETSMKAERSDEADDRYALVPVNGYDNLQAAQTTDQDEEWAVPTGKKSKKKKKKKSGIVHDREYDDEMDRNTSIPPSDVCIPPDRDLSWATSGLAREDNPYGARSDDFHWYDHTQSAASGSTEPNQRRAQSRGIIPLQMPMPITRPLRLMTGPEDVPPIHAANKDRSSYLLHSDTPQTIVAAAVTVYAVPTSDPYSFIVDDDVDLSHIKPAIDPEYGDLLPLPPSPPGSQPQRADELPAVELPGSRPETPVEMSALAGGISPSRSYSIIQYEVGTLTRRIGRTAGSSVSSIRSSVDDNEPPNWRRDEHGLVERHTAPDGFEPHLHNEQDLHLKHNFTEPTRDDPELVVPTTKPAMEIGAGGLVPQPVARDLTPSQWEPNPVLEFKIRIVDSTQFHLETGIKPTDTTPTQAGSTASRGKLLHKEIDRKIQSIAELHHASDAAGADYLPRDIMAAGSPHGAVPSHTFNLLFTSQLAMTSGLNDKKSTGFSSPSEGSRSPGIGITPASTGITSPSTGLTSASTGITVPSTGITSPKRTRSGSDNADKTPQLVSFWSFARKLCC